MIPILSCLLVIGAAHLFAREEAKIDAWLISLHMRIDHPKAWCFRVTVMALIVSLLTLVVELWQAVPLLAISGASFSASFRYRLNKMRGMHTCYISPWSNVYDGLFYRLYMWSYTLFRFGMWIWPTNDMLHVTMVGYTRGATVSVQGIHRSGRLAYVSEFAMAAGCLLWMGPTI